MALAAALSRRGAAVELVTDARALKYGGEISVDAIHSIPAATTTGAGALSKARATAVLGAGLVAALALIARLKPRVGRRLRRLSDRAAADRRGSCASQRAARAERGRRPRQSLSRAARVADCDRISRAQAASPPALAAKTRYTGNPVRPAVIAAAATPYPSFDDGRLNLLVTGGSQGARVMADVVPAALALLCADERARMRLTMQARGEDKARVAAACAEIEFPVELADFFADLPARMARAHLVVGRSGASTVSELAVIGRPSILVPFPHALDQDQAANAAVLAAAGAATVVPQREFTSAAARRADARRARRSGALGQCGGRRPRRSASPTRPIGWRRLVLEIARPTT